MFNAPAWLPRSIVIVLAVGFVPALIFSWVFELTPDGIKRDAEVKPEESTAPQTARRLWAAEHQRASFDPNHVSEPLPR